VAAVATDEQFLGDHDLGLDALRCAASMDGEGYDVVAGATESPGDWKLTYTDAFGTDPDVWAEASPLGHVAAQKSIAEFFVAVRGSEWRLGQHLVFVDALIGAGVPVTTLDASPVEHIDLTALVGAPGDALVTPAVQAFLDGCFEH
jgi:hypothetical protein